VPYEPHCQFIGVRKVRPQLKHYRQQAAMSAAEFGSVEKNAAHRVQTYSLSAERPMVCFGA
jgi:hypothetical protein